MKYCPACNFSFPDFHHLCDFDGSELVLDPERPALVKARRSRLWQVFKSPTFLTGFAILTLILSAFLIGCLEAGLESMPTVKSQTLVPPVIISSADLRVTEQRKPQVQLPATPTDSASLKSFPRSSHTPLNRQRMPTRLMARRNQGTSNGDPSAAKTRTDLSSEAMVPREVAVADRKEPGALTGRVAQTSKPSPVVAPGAQKSETAARAEAQPNRTGVMQTARREVSNEKSSKIAGFFKSTWKVLKKPFDF